MRDRAVPAWPVIGLTFEDGAAVADAAGVGRRPRIALHAQFIAKIVEPSFDTAHLFAVD